MTAESNQSLETLDVPCDENGAPQGTIDASVVVICFNAGDTLTGCLEALQPLQWREVVVVDNASTDDSIGAALVQWPGVTVVRSAVNLGFAGGANLGAHHTTGSVLIFLNPDTYPETATLQYLVNSLIDTPGVAGPLVYQQATQGYEAGAVVDISGIPHGLSVNDSRLPLYITGCCLATNRSCFDLVGGFDTRYFMFVEDVEYCWQALRRGFEVSVVREAVIDHAGGAVAPGGYPAANDTEWREVSVARVLLRERNTTIMLLACVPIIWLPIVLIISIIRTAAFACLLVRLGAWRSIAGLLFGLGQVVWWIPETLRRRRKPGVTKPGIMHAWARVVKRPFLLDSLGESSRVRLVGARSVGPRSSSWERAVGM